MRVCAGVQERKKERKERPSIRKRDKRRERERMLLADVDRRD